MDPVDAEEVLMICGYDHLNSTNGLYVFFDYEQCSIMILIESRFTMKGQTISSDHSTAASGTNNSTYN